MSAAENLLREVEEKRKRDLSRLESEYAEKKNEVTKPLKTEIINISDSARAQATELAQREQIRIEGAGKLQAKKILFDATEKMLEHNLSDLKLAFSDYAHANSYGDLIARMVKYASRRLGSEINVICRREDAHFIEAAGASVISSNLNSIGGFKAENSDGSLELDLTFEEILRNHQDQIRAIIQSA